MPARTKFLVIAAVAALTFLLGAAPSGAGTSDHATGHLVDWPQFHGRPDHQGFNKAETGVGVDNVDSLGPSWRGYGGGAGDDLVTGSSPAVVDGFVYFGTMGGQLLAFRDGCRSGFCEPAWRIDLRQAIQDSPAVANGVLYVGTSSRRGWLYAFDIKACAAGDSCRRLWRAKVNVGSSSPTVAGGVVYVGSYDGGLYAFAADGCGQATCEPLWVGHTDGRVSNSPAVAKGIVYAGDSSGYLYAFDSSGCAGGTNTTAVCRAQWRGHAANAIYSSSPAVHNGLVYIASFGADPQSYLEVFPALGCGKDVCRPIWRGTGGHYLNSAPAVAYGNVYIGSGDGRLLVYPARGCGDLRCPVSWFGYAAGSVATMESAPMVANGVVYVGENKATVRAYPAHGCGRIQCDKLWQFVTDDPIVESSPVMVNGTLYLSGTSYSTVPELYVFDLSSS